MSIYRCNSCGHVAEEPALAVGGKSTCLRCQKVVTLFSPAFYIEKLMERYQAVRRELHVLRSQEANTDGDADSSEQAASEARALLKEDMHSTLLLATAEQHEPLKQCLAARHAAVRFDYSQVDTSGFFDEAAAVLGDNYKVLSPVLEQLRYAYRQEWTWLNIDLGKKELQDRRVLVDLLRQLYGYTFFSRYHYNRKKESLGLGLQPAQPVRQFFTGSWLEWWCFLRALEYCLDHNVEFSCARSAQVELPSEELRELDVVFLLGGKTLLVVECKSGEFRGDLNKYSKLQKRLKLERDSFLICNPDIDSEQASALTAMYGLTFVNLESFPQYLATLRP